MRFVVLTVIFEREVMCGINIPLIVSMKYIRISICIILVIHVASVRCENVSYVRKQYTDLFSNYTKEAMPVYDHSKPLMVGVTFYLTSVNSFKEVNETISITGSFNFNWKDPFLAWNQASYGHHQHCTAI